MIRLIDILTAQSITLGRYKIHLATAAKSSPLEAYWQGTFKEWQEEQNARNFQCETVISLIQHVGDRWIFGGVYRVLGVRAGVNPRFKYETELLPGQGDLIGRVIVKFRRNFRASYIKGDKFGKHLEVAEIRESPLSIEEFDGYNNVLLSHNQLKVIVQKRESSWWSALKSVSGVYLILDTATGKTYVGSAYGKGGIWQRWCAYAETSHGGNVEMKTLLETNGDEYADNFQYSILEISDPLATVEQMLERESHWKDVLMSRTFGYNH